MEEPLVIITVNRVFLCTCNPGNIFRHGVVVSRMTPGLAVTHQNLHMICFIYKKQTSPVLNGGTVPHPQDARVVDLAILGLSEQHSPGLEGGVSFPFSLKVHFCRVSKKKYRTMTRKVQAELCDYYQEPV